MRVVLFVASFFTILAWSTGNAYAYLDPGLGSMLLQGLVAGVAVASVAVSGYWARIKSFFAGRRQARREPEETARH